MVRVAGVVLLLVFGSAPGAAARQEQATLDEGHAKAAFLINFAKFVQWPSSSMTGPLVIGVSGDDAVADLLGSVVRDRSIGGRSVIARRVSAADDPDACHILYIAGSRAREAAEMLTRIRGPVLTIGETVQFVRDGGMARFYIENKRMRFHINRTNAEAAGLKISSQLLTLSTP